ncbi:hypothetical protein NK987_16380 [Aquiflexum sp. XJ19-10]|nr:hypothetical protein [Aquiflexum gelatinilyticum]
MPPALASHPLVQKAAKSAEAFRLNEALNGKTCPSNSLTNFSSSIKKNKNDICMKIQITDKSLSKRKSN